MLETWKPVKGYEGLYEVSDRGRVKSLEREISFKSKNQFGVFYTGYKAPEKILTPIVHKSGYLVVNLYFADTHKTKTIHRLVAEAFIDKPDGKSQVNHIDGNKVNNSVGNLEWVTPSENIKHAYKTALLTHPTKPVYQITPVFGLTKRWNGIGEAARTMRLAESGVRECCRGERVSYGGYIWRYCNDTN